MCTVPLPPGVNPIAVKYIISHHIISIQDGPPNIKKRESQFEELCGLWQFAVLRVAC
jgi:hypothetical protein